MPLQRLLRAFALVLLLVPSIAFACEEWQPMMTLTAKVEPGINAGKLVLSFHNPNRHDFTMPIRVRADSIDYDWLTVELSNEHTQRVLTFMHDRDEAVQEDVTIPPLGTHTETIDLDPLTHDLPRGEYTVTVKWSAPAAIATTTTLAPYRCGLEVARHLGVPRSEKPSKLPYVLGALAIALLAVLSGLAWRLRRRGVVDARMPHSVP